MKRSREPDDSLPLPSITTPNSTEASFRTGILGVSHAASGPATPFYTSDNSRASDERGQPHAKVVEFDPEQSDAEGAAEAAMISCLLHKDKMDFPSFDAYETHYNKEHLNRCLECRRNFPSPLYLSLHSDEWHDPFVAVKRDKGEHTYACFVEGCERKCASADKRRRHLIDKHSFPKNFFFAITQYGIDGRRSLLEDGGRRQHHRRRSSIGNANATKKDIRRRTSSVTSQTNTTVAEPRRPTAEGSKGGSKAGDGSRMEASEESDREATATDREVAPDVEMEDLAGALSAMSFVPRSIKFGRGGKAGFSRR